MSGVDRRCARAVALVAGLSEATPDELHRARLHVSNCPSCADALDVDAEREHCRDRHTFNGRSDSSEQRPTTQLLPSMTSLRVVLGAVAVIQAALATRWLLGTTSIPGDVATAHVTRDGALGLTVAAAGLGVVFRPRFATGLLIVGSTALAVQVAAAAIDDRSGWVDLPYEGVHVLGAAIVVCMLLVARRQKIVLPPKTKAPHLSVLPAEAEK